MGDMGWLMATGVVFCMIAALTVVPAILMLMGRKKGKLRIERSLEAGLFSFNKLRKSGTFSIFCIITTNYDIRTWINKHE